MTARFLIIERYHFDVGLPANSVIRQSIHYSICTLIVSIHVGEARVLGS